MCLNVAAEEPDVTASPLPGVDGLLSEELSGFRDDDLGARVELEDSERGADGEGGETGADGEGGEMRAGGEGEAGGERGAVQEQTGVPTVRSTCSQAKIVTVST